MVSPSSPLVPALRERLNSWGVSRSWERNPGAGDPGPALGADWKSMSWSGARARTK